MISAVHDIREKVTNYIYLKKKISKYKSKIKTFILCKLSKHIITVSYNSKEEIMSHYKVNSKNISVIYSSWQHILSFVPDESIFEKNENIRKGEYFFSNGTLAGHKNFKWVLEIAKRHTNDIFVITGNKDTYKHFLINFNMDKLKNVIWLGYVSDNELCALYKHCKAFIFPSFYEGFGLPPLEAVAFGVKAIVSNASCLPEIYENYVYYIDPYEYSINLNELLNKEVDSAEALLDKFSWKRSAMQLYNLLKEYL